MLFSPFKIDRFEFDDDDDDAVVRQQLGAKIMDMHETSLSLPQIMR